MRVKPSSKDHHHGEAVCRSSGMALVFPATTPPGASAEGNDQEQCCWVLINNANRLRNKNLHSRTFYFSFFILWTHRSQWWWYYDPPLHSLLLAPPLHTIIHWRPQILVGCWVSHHQSVASKATMYFNFRFYLSIWRSKWWDGVSVLPRERRVTAR